jgi:hypothetical protein
MKILYLFVLLIVVCILLSIYRIHRETFTSNIFNNLNPNMFNNAIRDTVSNVGIVNREIENMGRFWNGIAQDWIPNVGWIYRYRDKSIELARARRGLPPLLASSPDVKINVNTGNNRYTTGFSP